jgi:hypothetical protein
MVKIKNREDKEKGLEKNSPKIDTVKDTIVCSLCPELRGIIKKY